MTEHYYRSDQVSLYLGDCRDVLAALPTGSVDAIVTSPPYAMQRATTYGGVPENEYPDWTVAWMNEVWRVLKPDGSVIINIRPHIKNGQISDYTLRTRLALRDAGWCEVDELIWHKPNGMPTGSPRKPRRSWESLHWFAKHGQPWSDAKANGKQSTWSTNVATYKHVSTGGQSRPDIARCADIASVVITEPAGDYPHPARYPTALAEWCGKLICPPGGTILDPFTGSSSTGVAAIDNGWQFIGIDAVPEYLDMSRLRLEAEVARLEDQPPTLDFGAF